MSFHYRSVYLDEFLPALLSSIIRLGGRFNNFKVIEMGSLHKAFSSAFKTTLLATILMTPLGVAKTSFAQESDSNASLLARQQMRLNNVEDNLKQVRGTIETELRAIRLQIEKISGSSTANSSSQAAAIKDLKGQIAELSDSLDIFNQRLRRSIELSSDVEFRVLRLEKRMQTLLSLSGDNLASAVIQDDVIAVGDNPSVAMSRDDDTGGSTWTVEKDEAVQEELDKVLPADNESLAVADNQSELANEADDSALIVTQDADNSSDSDESQLVEDSAPEAVEEVASVLPDGSPEEQYRFALSRALQNDLETAELAFAEFRTLHEDHERSADVLYWLGRVQFIQGQYEKSAMTFTEFNSEFQSDSRLPDAILMIAESVVNFATAEQACQIFADLPQLLDQPPETFTTRLDELKQDKACAN